LRYVIAIPYTRVVFRTTKGDTREVCIDSFSLAYISDPCRVSLLTYPCKSVSKYGLSPSVATLGIKMLKRELPSHKAFERVIELYRLLNDEALQLRRRTMPKPSMSILMLISPWYGRASNEDLDRLSKLTISLMLLEKVLGRDVLTEEPLINEVSDVTIALEADIEGSSIKFLGNEPFIKVYDKLIEMDENLRAAMLRELTK